VFSIQAQIAPIPDGRNSWCNSPSQHEVIVTERALLQENLPAAQIKTETDSSNTVTSDFFERIERMGWAISGAESPAAAT